MGDTPSKPQYRVTKNGVEARQDKEIDGLRSDLREFREEDRAVHGDIIAQLKKYIFAGKIIWAGAAIVMAGLTSLLGWMVAEIGSHDDRIQDVKSDHAGIMRHDISMQAEIDDVELELRALRRLVNEHQRSKDEHLQRQRKE